MNDSRHPDDDTPIPDDVADRILAEASKLDEESERTQLTVAQLRAAAVEAGISEEAFEAALEDGARRRQDGYARNNEMDVQTPQAGCLEWRRWRRDWTLVGRIGARAAGRQPGVADRGMLCWRCGVSASRGPTLPGSARRRIHHRACSCCGRTCSPASSWRLVSRWAPSAPRPG